MSAIWVCMLTSYALEDVRWRGREYRQLRCRRAVRRPQLAQLFQSGAVGNHDEAIADSHAALALPRAQVLVHALASRPDDVAELPLREVDPLDGRAVDDQSVRGRQSQQ